VLAHAAPQYFWDLMDTGIVMMGYAPISAKFHLPLWLLWIVAYMGDLFVKLTGRYEGRSVCVCVGGGEAPSHAMLQAVIWRAVV
jgi:hypothetical protein